MFYGTIKSDGSIDTNYSHSNNFSVSKTTTTGKYMLYFNQYLSYSPTLSLIVVSGSTTNAYPVSYQCTSTAAPYTTVEIYTWSNLTTRAYKPFSFIAQYGMRRIFTAPQTLTLTPEVKSFTPASGGTATTVLVLSTMIGTEKVYLDEGSMLIAVGNSMTVKLSATSVTLGSTTWNLTGYTYGGGSGADGTAWLSNGTGPTLTADPANTGPVTTPYSFVVKGVRSAGTGAQYLSSDPVVRLTSVSPGGMKL